MSGSGGTSGEIRDDELEVKPFQLTVGPFSETTPFPSFGKPVIRGAFSLDSSRSYVEGPVSLQFLQLPKSHHVHFDLNKLCATAAKDPNYNKKDEDAMHRQTNELIHLLEWIKRHDESFKRRRPDFVFYRGLMTKLLGTPYEGKEKWKVGATLKNGTIYLRNIDTPENIADRLKESQDVRRRTMSAWGHNFEHFLLSDAPLGRPTPDVPRQEECNAVFQTKLGSHELLYAAEIDGVWLPEGNEANPKKEPSLLNTCRLVELKTTRLFRNGEMHSSFRRFNLRKWWSQTFTTGISHVVVGFRDDEGIVHELKIYPLDFLVKEGLGWSSTVCFNFLDKFLTEVKKTLKNIENTEFVFEYCPAIQNKELLTVLNVTVEKSSALNLSSLI